MGSEGAPFWVHLDAVLVDEAPGHQVCQATLTDITRQKTAEEESRQQNERLLHLVDELTEEDHGARGSQRDHHSYRRDGPPDGPRQPASLLRVAGEGGLPDEAPRQSGGPCELRPRRPQARQRSGRSLGRRPDPGGFRGAPRRRVSHRGPGRQARRRRVLRAPAGYRPGRRRSVRRKSALRGAGLRRTPRGSVTVSGGVACWTPGDAADDLLRRADEALYVAKRSGGDDRGRRRVARPDQGVATRPRAGSQSADALNAERNAREPSPTRATMTKIHAPK